MKVSYRIIGMGALLCAFFSGAANSANIISDNFTSTATSNNWYFFNGACLTAGTGTSTASPGQIPGCSTVLNSYYASSTQEAALPSYLGSGFYDTTLIGGQNGVAATPTSTCVQGTAPTPTTACGSTRTTLPDPVGKGALRFTNGFPWGYFEKGAIISATPFNAGQGVQVTFKTVTYRGDEGGPGGDGADGIGFFLMDASKNNPAANTWGIGAVGGSLGYSCSDSNPPYDGLVGGYLGLGIDEYGNFLNGNALVSGYSGSNTATGDNSAYGYGYKPNRIGLRGAGSVSWNYLNGAYPTYYPSSLSTQQRQWAVQWTCIYGNIYNFATYTPVDPRSNPSSTPTVVRAASDYYPIPNGYLELPSSVQIAAETAMSRPAATPIIYSLKITQDGLLTFAYSINGGAYQPVVTGLALTSSNGALPSSLYFGFVGSTGGSTNIHEILCFKAAPPDQSSSSAAVDQKQTTEVQSTSQAYFSFYNPNDWTGRIAAYSLVDTSGVVSVANNAIWDSECVLTGVPTGTCVTTGVAAPATAESPSSRVMLTWNGIDSATNAGTGGIPFEWPGTGITGITTSEENILDAGDALPYNSNRLSYLRGVRTNEINSTGVGLYRARDGVLGDIIDSSPVWIGPPSSPYAITWRDRLVSSDSMLENSGTQTYKAFVTAEQSRLNVVYVGANDGFLHGFESGSQNSSGALVNNSTTPNDGAEVLAYMPGAILNTIHNSSVVGLDYSNSQYGHNFYVDATPGNGDLFYQGAWHTWLVGGLGAGGSAIYALDITDAQTLPFAESNAANLVKGEWSPATLSCVNNSGCGASLGNTYGTPQIRRFHNGMWGAVFGNGYGSATGDAGIYVMLVNQSSGALQFYYLSTGTGSAAINAWNAATLYGFGATVTYNGQIYRSVLPNILSAPPSIFWTNVTTTVGDGISDVTTADLDGDHITDFIYAGDLNGNVWRFDLTNANPALWAVTPGPLFTTPSGQPITTPVVIASVTAATSTPQVMVGFGTGHRTQFTNSTAASYVSGTQSLYGVWDTNFTAWNLISNASYATLTGSPTTASVSNLQVQTLTAGSGVVTTSNNPVTWATSCGTSCNGSLGWYANLPGASGAMSSSGAALDEQIISPPGIYESAMIVNSDIPADNSILNCSSSTTDGGTTYAISMATGGLFSNSGSSGTQSAFTAYQNTSTVGVISNETGALSVVNTSEKTTYLLGQLTQVGIGQAPAGLQQISLPNNVKYNRLTWVELR